MARSKVTIEFLDVPSVNDELKILEENLVIYMNQTFKEFRFSTGQCKIPSFEPADGMHPDRYFGNIATNYESAFNLDYNSTSLFTVTKTLGPTNSGIGTVIIQANYDNALFLPISVPGYINLSIENQETIPSFTITDFNYSVGSNPCNNITVNVETSVLATKILQPIINNSNTNNPLSFEVLRGSQYTLELEDSNGQKILQTFNSPGLLNASNFSLQINNSPNGATVVVDNDSLANTGLTFEYSLDNSVWQTSNVFSGLDVGDYTVYIKDQFGCSISKQFNVSEFGIYVPYFYISKANSIRFANRIEWGDSANYKTDENTLSCEVDVEIPYKEIQQFQSADVITTQFESNYSNNIVKIITSDNLEINVPVEKKTNFIGLKEKLDARQYSLGNGQTGIYFISGNTYNFYTNIVESAYSLNGLVPYWAKPGNYIIIGASWFLIEEVIYDQQINCDVIVINYNYTGPEINVVVGSVYNVFDKEVFEFTIDMANYIDQFFRVKIECSDSHFETITHLSEEIWCKVKHDNVLEIQYYNSKNTDIMYSTGIRHKIRIPYSYMKGKDESDSENHKTDTNTILLSSSLYESEEIIFEPVTKEIWRKLKIALSSEKVFINGVGYVKNGDFNTEVFEKTNLYVLTATMIKTGNVYNSSAGEIDYDFSNAMIPGLIQTNSGFVKY